jgi:hypothetical protein
MLDSIDHLCKCKHRIAWIVARERWIETHPIHIRSWVCWDEVSWHQLLTLWILRILYNFWIWMKFLLHDIVLLHVFISFRRIKERVKNSDGDFFPQSLEVKLQSFVAKCCKFVFLPVYPISFLFIPYRSYLSHIVPVYPISFLDSLVIHYQLRRPSFFANWLCRHYLG